MGKRSRPSNLPIMIITGASGFIGRHCLQKFKSDYYIYAIARRAETIAQVEPHENIVWIRVDISSKIKIDEVFETIIENGGADFLLHLAGFFTFDNKKDPEYTRTNVNGTKYILQAARKLKLKRFIFASSITVTSFEKAQIVINENSPNNAKFPYALSKTKAEELIKEYSSYFPCTVVRLSAIFSDWCEYKPLYSFLNTWLSGMWRNKILAGRGEAAIPYLHIRDLTKFFQSLIINTDELNQYKILIASPEKSTSHKELYKIASGFSYFHSIKPILIPKIIIVIGVIFKMFWGKITRHLPFERIWMMKYIDKKMIVDSSKTRSLLSWEPTKRYDINHRLLFIITNMKRNPFDYKYKNEFSEEQAVLERKYLKIYEGMIKLENDIIQDTFAQLVSIDESNNFPTYQKLNHKEVLIRVKYIYKMLEFDVRTGDRTNILEYGQNLAEARFAEGFESTEVINAIQVTADVIVKKLLTLPDLKGMEQRIHDEVMMTLQMVIESFEDRYEQLILG